MRLPMNTSLATLKPSGIRRINALAVQYPGCIALALGEPDFSTPDMISAEVTASLDRGDTHYPPNNGRPALREALSAYMGDAGLTFSADEVILTDGATEALSATFMAMLNPGDEVIIPTPAFGLYESIVVANHAKAVFLDTEPAQFQIDEDALRACVTPATKAIVICSPNNPTGCILDAASLDAWQTWQSRRASTWSATTYTTVWSMWMATSALPSATRSYASRRWSSRAFPSPGP